MDKVKDVFVSESVTRIFEQGEILVEAASETCFATGHCDQAVWLKTFSKSEDELTGLKLRPEQALSLVVLLRKALDFLEMKEDG